MSDVRKSFENLSSEKRQLVEEMISKRKKNQDPRKDSGNASSGEAELKSYYKSLNLDQRIEREFARFAPFDNIVNDFSWIELLFNHKKNLENAKLFLKAQDKMRSVLFRGIDFSSIDKILDIGCGYSSDLLALAEKHPHIKFHGYNISPDQVEAGNEKIEALGYCQRINLYIRNSAKEPFLDIYDLIFSCQVIHHIKKKEDVFLNIGQNLCNGGFFVAAEILSNLPMTPIEDPKSSAYFSTRSEWAELLAKNNLRVVEAVDTSLEIANFLYDPNFSENLTRLTKDYDEVARDHLIGPHELGELLRRKLATYIILTVQKDQYLKKETILRLNLEKLSILIPYSKIIEASKDEEPILLPNLSLEGLNLQTSLYRQERQSSSSFLARIVSQEPEQRKLTLESYLKTQIANILKLAQSEIEVKQPLNTLGADSLMFMEFRNRIQNDLQIEIPIANLMADINITILATQVSELLNQVHSEAPVVSSDNSKQEQTEPKDSILVEGEL